MNNFRRFQIGAKVTYIGEKLAKELSGSLGIVEGFVGGQPNGVVVTFGSDAYVMDATRHLTEFQGKLKSESHEEEKKDPPVEKRKGVSKRKTEDQDSE
jgi:hypothetical protein